MSWKAFSTVTSVLQETLSSWIKNDAPQMGAALAYYFIFSIGPVLVLSVAIAGSFFGEDQVRDQVVTEFRDLVGYDGAKVIETLMVSAYKGESSRITIIVGTFTLIFAASGVVFQLKSALNRIWRVEPPPGMLRHWVRGYILSLTTILGLSVLLILAVVTSAGIAFLGKYIPPPLSDISIKNPSMITSLALFTAIFAATFKWLPDTFVAWRDVWLGAVVASVLFEIGKLAIGLYIGKRGFTSTYGAAGSLVVILVWVYYSAQIVFFGAELAYVISRRRMAREARGPDSSA